MMSNGTNTSFVRLQQINAGVLNVGYAEAGPSDGPAVMLLHGWPYDIHSYVDVAPLLASTGYRVIVPYLRGYGTTRFLSSDTLRNGQQSVVAIDSLALMDALKIERAILAGFDWGARTADIIAAIFPGRCKALVSVSGYLIGNQQAGQVPLPPNAAGLATRPTGMTLRSSSGSSLRHNGTSTMPPSSAAPRPSTIRIMSAS
jgi:pimeloyl-ACP methyl ester carboxylesterase